jgi:hypothetical protein
MHAPECRPSPLKEQQALQCPPNTCLSHLHDSRSPSSPPAPSWKPRAFKKTHAEEGETLRTRLRLVTAIGVFFRASLAGHSSAHL